MVPGHLVIASGEIDVATAPQLGEAIAECPDGDVIVDLTSVEFMDSTGLKVLLAAQRLVNRRGARLLIHYVSPIITRLIEITRLDEVLNSRWDGSEAQDASTSSQTS